MGREDEIVKERLKKIEELRKQKINPYSHKFDLENEREHSDEIIKQYSSLKNEEISNKTEVVAGRIMFLRSFGKLAFAKVQDSKGIIQVVLQSEKTPEKCMELFNSFIDTGDIIGVKGNPMKTKTGEMSILVKELFILTKSILPLPDKVHGLTDEEERLRKRYLDMTVNPEVKKVFVTRAKILEVLRDFMKKNDFIEVETPLLQSVYGGAAAKPFKTHCEAYNSNLFLSIAPELYLKKALVGGFERVYEITKKFRNEGVDRQHNPEHMTIEWYQGYADYNDGMRLFEEMMKDIALALFGKTEIEYQGKKINLAKWRRLPLLDAIKEYLSIDISKVKDDKEAREIAKKHGIEKIDEITKINLPDELMKLFRDKIIEPTFLTDYPVEMCPLAKPSQRDPTKAEIFQPLVAGMELARAYSELNNPKLQEANFKGQEDEREKGNKEAMPTDMDFVTALEHGMPPACGVGVGIERLVMLFANQVSIREVIMFPFMKPVEILQKSKSESKKPEPKKGSKKK